MSDSKGKTALITGASRGIGRAVAIDLANNGVNIAFSYLNNDMQAQSLADQIIGKGVGALPVRADVTSPEDANRLVKLTKDTFGGVDYLVNNAGITRDKSLMLMTDDDWRVVIETNLSGTFYLTRAVLTGFLKKKFGSIVNISSTAGLTGNPGQSNYSSSKAGIIGFTKSLARETAPYGIRVNAVAPGFIRTRSEE